MVIKDVDNDLVDHKDANTLVDAIMSGAGNVACNIEPLLKDFMITMSQLQTTLNLANEQIAENKSSISLLELKEKEQDQRLEYLESL